MIKPYVGIIYLDGKRDDEHTIEVTEKDGYCCGECDICGCDVEDDDVGAIVAPSIWDIKEMAVDEEWIVIGHHLICPGCENKIRNGHLEIEIRKVMEDGVEVMKKIRRSRILEFCDWCSAHRHCFACKYYRREMEGRCYKRWLKDNQEEKHEEH